MLRLCRPVHGFVRYYGTVRSYDQYQGAPTSSDTTSATAMANPTRSYLQHYGYVGSGHYYVAQYYVTASFDPMAMVRSYGCARFYGSVVPRRP
jgi:hypothetical protein